MISLTVLAVVLTITYATFSATTGQIGAVRESSEVHQQARVIFERMFKDLTGCAVCLQDCDSADRNREPVFRPLVCEGSLDDRASFTTLSFSSTSHLAMTERTRGLDLSGIVYRLEEDESDADLLILSRSDDPYPGTSDLERRFLVLGERIVRIRLEFIDRAGEAHEEWDSSRGSQAGRLPRRVRLSFTIRAKDGSEVPFSSGWVLPAGLL